MWDLTFSLRLTLGLASQVGIARPEANESPGMTSKTGSARAVTLALERLTQTAIIDGDVVDIPQREFTLLLELAARPGTPIHTKKLVTAVWADTPGMTSQDLYVVVSNLRNRIGEADRADKLIRNQKRLGYYLDLAPEQVLVADNLDEVDGDLVVTLEPEIEPDQTEVAPTQEPAAVVSESHSEISSPPRVRPRLFRPVAMGALALVAIASSWSAGYLISTRLGNQERAAVPPPSDQATTSSVANPDLQPREQSRSERRKSNKASKKSRKARSQDEPNAVAAAPVPAPPPPPSSQSGSGGRVAQTQPAKQPKPPAPLPPPPTRFLYHLVNADSGDHFVTTDGNVASQYHARGYEGGAIGRVYTSALKGTRAISTNQGTAYIFIEANPKTEPASRAVALWYSTDNAGDFFYTTSEAEAKQSGWSARVVGYIGAS